jgi:hypothetical protein
MQTLIVAYKRDVEQKDIKASNKQKMSFFIVMAAIVVVVVIFASISNWQQIRERERVQAIERERVQAIEREIEQREQEFLEASMVFGSYEGKALEWLILAEEGGKTLLITKDCIAQMPYNNERASITWEKCTLRKWLNEGFYNVAFSEAEKAKIVESNVINNDNANYGTQGGNDTVDRVVLLSLAEAKKYFPNDTVRKATFNESQAWWWLRSPGNYSGNAAYINTYGTVDVYGFTVRDRGGAVRPALWIRAQTP